MTVFPDLVLNWNHSNERAEYALEGGITKRELFAAMAMQGQLDSAYSDLDIHAEAVAYRAVAFADALLAALEKTP